MKIIRAYRTALNPTPTQRAMLRRQAGCCRYVWNAALSQRKLTYQSWLSNDPTGTTKAPQLNLQSQGPMLTKVLQSGEFPWLRDEVPRAALNATLQNMDHAYSAFFRRIKNGEAPGYPKFKGRNGRQSIKFFSSVRVEHDAIHLSKVGRVKLHEHGYLPTGTVVIKSGAITWEGRDERRWYVSITVEEEIPDPTPTGDSVTVHLGLRKLAYIRTHHSDGTSTIEEVDHPKAYENVVKRLRFLSRSLSRRKEGSARWHGARRRVNLHHQHVANVRRDIIQKLTTRIMQMNPRSIRVQAWGIAAMLEERKFSLRIADAAWGEIVRELEYKSKWIGAGWQLVSGTEPVSKRCSSCGVVDPNFPLGRKIFTCAACGMQKDRELNALDNLDAVPAEKCAGRKKEKEPKSKCKKSA